ncbi:hypothetical protein [Xanthomarina spongicola]|uniref:Lipoprotein n=1 Tax=Xanthomarina spongicola TaxID=570520 RepID=A0A316DS78_9FLAO|nr:hypothetical protein [Xanthomarina spongicola]PWK20029.1 hypothetical protein LX78_01380 [Xanthomarina spongicola]
MKKTIYLIILILGIISCKSQKNNKVEKPLKIDLSSEILAKVYKIDSINNYYLIYVSNEKLNYKIISEKVSHENCNKVVLDSLYSFRVESLLLTRPRASEGVELPVNYSDFEKCIDVPNNTKICTEVGIRDICKSKNLLGLCYRIINQ